MRKCIIISIVIALFLFVHCSSYGAISVKDNNTKWDKYFHPEDPVIYNNIWVNEQSGYDLCIAIINVSVFNNYVLLEMTGLQDPGLSGKIATWSYDKDTIIIEQYSDDDKEKEIYYCAEGEPETILTGENKLTTVRELEEGKERFKWKLWFKGVTEEGKTFDVNKPFDFIEDHPGGSKFYDVFIVTKDSVTDKTTKWDDYFQPENPVIYNNIWEGDTLKDSESEIKLDYCLAITDIKIDKGLILIEMTGLQDKSQYNRDAYYAFSDSSTTIRQDVDSDGKLDKFKCIYGDPENMVDGDMQKITTIDEFENGQELFRWKMWFEGSNSDGLEFDINKPFSLIESCSSGCAKFEDVWLVPKQIIEEKKRELCLAILPLFNQSDMLTLNFFSKSVFLNIKTTMMFIKNEIKILPFSEIKNIYLEFLKDGEITPKSYQHLKEKGATILVYGYYSSTTDYDITLEVFIYDLYRTELIFNLQYTSRLDITMYDIMDEIALLIYQKT